MNGLLNGNEKLWSPLLETAQSVGTRITMRLEEIIRYGTKIVDQIDALILRLTAEEARNFLEGAKWPDVLKGRLPNLVEIEMDDDLLDRLDKIPPLFPESTILSAVVRIDQGYVDCDLRPSPVFQKILEPLLLSPFDILCITSDYDTEKGYYPTTDGVPAVHRFLVEQKLRHRFSIVASGGIRSAADGQKTVQRGANGVKIDWPVLLVGDPGPAKISKGRRD
jgi:hypothetical protein